MLHARVCSDDFLAMDGFDKCFSENTQGETFTAELCPAYYPGCMWVCILEKMEVLYGNFVSRLALENGTQCVLINNCLRFSSLNTQCETT